MTASILLIEDDRRLASVIQRGLLAHDFKVANAWDGESGLKLATHHHFDIVISDIMLPDMDGIEVCKQLRKNVPNTYVIILTALGTTDDKIEGFDAGADDYMVKPFELRELVVRIRALLNRGMRALLKQESVLQYADLELNLDTKTVLRGQQSINLTAKEFNLLHYMLQHAEKVLSRDEIAENVWNVHFDTGTNFIDVYINYLRKKIDKPFNKKLIHTRPGLGFVLTNKL
jgi:DNA-binding response OmpR family regulator